MKAKKWIGVNLGKSFFIVHIINEKGMHKIQKHSWNETGLKDFMEDLDNETVVGVEKTPWTQPFIKEIKHLIKDYIILDKEDLTGFQSLTDEKNRPGAEALALIIQKSNF